MLGEGGKFRIGFCLRENFPPSEHPPYPFLIRSFLRRTRRELGGWIGGWGGVPHWFLSKTETSPPLKSSPIHDLFHRPTLTSSSFAVESGERRKKQGVGRGVGGEVPRWFYLREDFPPLEHRPPRSVFVSRQRCGGEEERGGGRAGGLAQVWSGVGSGAGFCFFSKT